MRFLLFFLLFFPCAMAQQLSIIETRPLTAKAFIGYDTFGFQYFITENTLHKSNGLESVEYQNVSFGKITHVDLTNPLKIAVLYRDFNSVVLLDNQLNEIITIDFSALDNRIVVAAIGNASQNRLWFFNSLTQQIGLYEYQTHTYNYITQPMIGNILHFESDLNYFQWIDQGLKRFVVDVYGKIATAGLVPEFDAIRFTSNTDAIYRKDNSLYFISGTGKTQKLLDIDPKSFKSFWYKDQILAIFTADAITNYKITTP